MPEPNPNPTPTSEETLKALVKEHTDKALQAVTDLRAEVSKLQDAQAGDLGEKIEAAMKKSAEDAEGIFGKIQAEITKNSKRADELEIALKRSQSTAAVLAENKETRDEFNSFCKLYNLRQAHLVKAGIGDVEQQNLMYDAYKSAFNKVLRLSPDAKGFLQKGLAPTNDPAYHHADEWTDDEKKAFAIISDISKAASLTAGDATGGALLLPAVDEQNMRQQLWMMNPIRKYCRVIQIGAQELPILYRKGDSGSGWVGEVDARAQTAVPDFEEKTIKPAEIYANAGVSAIMLDDARYNVADFLINDVTRVFAIKEATAFMKGTGRTAGSKQPKGMLTVDMSTTKDDDTRRNAGSIDTPYKLERAIGTAKANIAEDMLTLYASMKREYAARGAKWFMSRATLSELYRLKDTQNNFIIQKDMRQDASFQFLGYPIIEIDEFDPLGAAANDIPMAFGLMDEFYTIVDRTNMRILIDPYTNKPYVLYYCTRRVGGDTVDGAAMKFLVMTA